MNKADFFEGECFCCGEGPVRQHDNLYTHGSEGTQLCPNCEKVVLYGLEGLHRRLSPHRRRIRQNQTGKESTK